MYKGNKIFLAGVALLTALCPDQGEAVEFAGVKSIGMAGAVSVRPVDAFTPAYNPAGGALICDRIDAGFDWRHLYQRTSLRDINSGGSVGAFNAAVDPAKGFAEVAINKTFSTHLGRFPLNFSVGVAYFTRSDIYTGYRSPLASDTITAGSGLNQTFLFGSTKTGFEYTHQVIAPSMALRIRNNHTLGVSLNYNIQKLNVKGIEQRATPISIATIDADALSNRGDDYSHGIGVTIGYIWEYNKCINIGVAFEPETKMDRFSKYRGFIADAGKFDLPWRVRAGISYQFTSVLAFEFDYEYVNWSSIPMLDNKANFSRPFGQDKGPGFGWMGQAIYRLGMDWRALSCLSVRFGYEHINRPFQDRKVTLNSLTQNHLEDTLTFGATYHYARHELSAFYFFGLQHSVFGGDSYSIVSPAGVSQQAMDIRKSMFALGVSWGYKF